MRPVGGWREEAFGSPDPQLRTLDRLDEQAIERAGSYQLLHSQLIVLQPLFSQACLSLPPSHQTVCVIRHTQGSSTTSKPPLDPPW